jgi:hypothetical protein
VLTEVHALERPLTAAALSNRIGGSGSPFLVQAGVRPRQPTSALKGGTPVSDRRESLLTHSDKIILRLPLSSSFRNRPDSHQVFFADENIKIGLETSSKGP